MTAPWPGRPNPNGPEQPGQSGPYGYGPAPTEPLPPDYGGGSGGPYGPGPYGPGPYGPGPYGPGPYGAPAGYPYAAAYPQQPLPGPAGPRNGFGVTALVCGVVGVLLGFVIYLFLLTAILGIVALIFGILGAGRARRGEATNQGMSIAGAVLGLIACVASVVGIVLVVDHVQHGVGKIGSYFECVGNIAPDDPQRDAKVQDCSSRFN